METKKAGQHWFLNMIVYILCIAFLALIYGKTMRWLGFDYQFSLYVFSFIYLFLAWAYLEAKGFV